MNHISIFTIFNWHVFFYFLVMAKYESVRPKHRSFFFLTHISDILPLGLQVHHVSGGKTAELGTKPHLQEKRLMQWHLP